MENKPVTSDEISGFGTQLLSMARELLDGFPHDGSAIYVASSRWFGLPELPLYGLEMAKTEDGFALRLHRFNEEMEQSILLLQTSSSFQVIEDAFVLTAFIWGELGDPSSINTDDDDLASMVVAGNA